MKVMKQTLGIQIESFVVLGYGQQLPEMLNIDPLKIHSKTLFLMRNY